MLFKLIALGLFAANPTPLVLKVAGEKWIELGSIEGIEPKKINKIIGEEWGLTINDFKWIKAGWFQHNDVWYDEAFALNLDSDHWFTKFYQRNHY